MKQRWLYFQDCRPAEKQLQHVEEEPYPAKEKLMHMGTSTFSNKKMGILDGTCLRVACAASAILLATDSFTLPVRHLDPVR